MTGWKEEDKMRNKRTAGKISDQMEGKERKRWAIGEQEGNI